MARITVRKWFNSFPFLTVANIVRLHVAGIFVLIKLRFVFPSERLLLLLLLAKDLLSSGDLCIGTTSLRIFLFFFPCWQMYRSLVREIGVSGRFQTRLERNSGISAQQRTCTPGGLTGTCLCHRHGYPLPEGGFATPL